MDFSVVRTNLFRGIKLRHMVIYRLCSILLALLCLGVAALGTFVCPKHAKFPGQLARHRLAGLLLGLVVLCWSAKEGAAMLPERFTTPIWLLVPIVAAGGWFLLDFLFVRAFGGFLVLLTNYLIQHAFAYYCGFRSFYCIMALVWGLGGMALIAWPWLMRDSLELLTRQPRSRPFFWAFCILSALTFIFLPFCGRS